MASEPKTRPTDASVDDFISAVENPTRRADAEVVRAMMDEITGETAVMWGPSIVGYGSYNGPTGDWPITGFSPRKTQMVLYVMGSADLDEKMGRLGKHTTGVSCLYVKKLADVDQAVLREIVEASVADMRARYPTG